MLLHKNFELLQGKMSQNLLKTTQNANYQATNSRLS